MESVNAMNKSEIYDFLYQEAEILGENSKDLITHHFQITREKQ